MKHTRRFAVAGLTATLAIGASGAMAATGGNAPPALELQTDETVLTQLQETDPVASETGDSPVSEPSPMTVEEPTAPSAPSAPSVEDEDEVAAADLDDPDGGEAALVESPPSEPSAESPPSEPSVETPPSEPSVETPPSEPSPESPASVEEPEDDGEPAETEA